MRRCFKSYFKRIINLNWTVTWNSIATQQMTNSQCNFIKMRRTRRLKGTKGPCLALGALHSPLSTFFFLLPTLCGFPPVLQLSGTCLVVPIPFPLPSIMLTDFFFLSPVVGEEEKQVSFFHQKRRVNFERLSCFLAHLLFPFSFVGSLAVCSSCSKNSLLGL